MRTVARYVVDAVAQAGVDVVFGLPGVHALGLFNAVEKAGLRYVGFRHEQAAAHAADGYGRATGKPGVVLLSTGPGTLNALSALAEAYVSSSPVLAVTSAIPTRFFGKQKGFLHETVDLAPAFRVVTKSSGRATTTEEVPGAVAEWLTASSGRPRPSIIELPVDLLDAPIEGEPPAVETKTNEPADPEAIGEAGMLCSLGARPVVWAGGGIHRARAWEGLRRVAELIDAPVVTTFMGKGAIPEDHPLSVGTMVRQPETADLLKHADLLLAVGTRFSGMATGNWGLELPSQLIHIDIDPEEIGRNYPARVGIVADAGEALRLLGDSLTERLKGGRKQAGGAERASAVRTAAFERARQQGPRELSFLEAMRSALDPETPTVQDMTIPSYWSWPFFPVTVPGTIHSPYGYASLGFSFPAAIGVAAADPSKPVVAVSGDGGFQYHARELATVAQYGLPVINIVFNDRSWGVLKSFSHARYQTTFGLDIPGPDFIALAQAHGVPAERAAEPEDLEKALSSAVDAGGPHLIEVPGEWSLPPPSEYYRR